MAVSYVKIRVRPRRGSYNVSNITTLASKIGPFGLSPWNVTSDISSAIRSNGYRAGTVYAILAIDENHTYEITIKPTLHAIICKYAQLNNYKIIENSTITTSQVKQIAIEHRQNTIMTTNVLSKIVSQVRGSMKTYKLLEVDDGTIIDDQIIDGPMPKIMEESHYRLVFTPTGTTVHKGMIIGADTLIYWPQQIFNPSQTSYFQYLSSIPGPWCAGKNTFYTIDEIKSMIEQVKSTWGDFDYRVVYNPNYIKSHKQYVTVVFKFNNSSLNNIDAIKAFMRKYYINFAVTYNAVTYAIENNREFSITLKSFNYFESINMPSGIQIISISSYDITYLPLEGDEDLFLIFVGDTEIIQYTLGMTWGEWLNSEFNTHNWYTENNQIFNADGERLVCIYDNNTMILLTSNVIASENGEYQFENSSVGGG